jgi:hypothetical protein
MAVLVAALAIATPPASEAIADNVPNVIGTWVVSSKKHPVSATQSAELASLTVKVLRQDGDSFSGTIVGLKGKSERIVGAFRRDGVTFIYSSEKTAGMGQVQGNEMQICRTDAGCAVLVRGK